MGLRYNGNVKTNGNMNNLQIAELLRAVAAAYTVKSKSRFKFKIIAYERAADAVEHLSSEAKDLWDEGELTNVAGIGESIARHLGEIFTTGKSKHFEKVFSGLPPAMFDLLAINGIGPKTAYKLTSELSISKNAVQALKKAASSGKIAKLEGFGVDSEREILLGIGEYERKPEKRMLLPHAMRIADEIKDWVMRCAEVEKIEVLGSLRRRASTIGDIDLAVATNSPKIVLDYFGNYPKKVRLIEKGDKKASVLLAGGVRVDLLVMVPEAFGAALQHFTGSKHHNIELRERALGMGLSLSEYGIKRIKNKELRIKNFADEVTFYKYLGLSYIEPELREGAGEIESAANNNLPKLVELTDLKADLQIHSSFDIETSHDLGESSMREIVKKAESLNYEYIALTEHNPSQSGHTQKDVVEILKRKREMVDELNYSISQKQNYRVIKVFNSLEIDILSDGSLPVNDDGLATLNFALVSIHSNFRLNREKMTKRVLTALDHPGVKIFAHPTGRKLNYREGVELNWEKIFEFCLEQDKWIEINADPARLDLPDFLVREAVLKGIRLTLGTDAHHVTGMNNMRWGVDVARRGWAEAKNIVNTLSLEKFERLL